MSDSKNIQSLKLKSLPEMTDIKKSDGNSLIVKKIGHWKIP